MEDVFPDENSFVRFRRFTQDDFSREQAQSFQEVVSYADVLSNERKTLQVWARLDQVIVNPLPQVREMFPESREGAGFSQAG